MGLFDCFKKKPSPQPQPQPQPQPVPPAPNSILFGYFATRDATGQSSVLESVDHCNMVFTVGWGDWTSYTGRQALMQNMIDDLKVAKAGGVGAAIVSLDFLVYTRSWAARQIASAEVELREFFDKLRAANVLSMVRAFYPVDEPNLVGIDAATIMGVNMMIRRIANDYIELANVKLAVIYTDHLDQLSGVGSYDWVGFDAYDRGAGIFTNGQYSTLKSQLRTDQRTLLVPGGASPWRTDPAPFYDKACSDSQVVAIVPFIWIDNWGLTGNQGIRSNGMAPAYRRIGTAIRTGTPPV